MDINKITLMLLALLFNGCAIFEGTDKKISDTDLCISKSLKLYSNITLTKGRYEQVDINGTRVRYATSLPPGLNGGRIIQPANKDNIFVFHVDYAKNELCLHSFLYGRMCNRVENLKTCGQRSDIFQPTKGR